MRPGPRTARTSLRHWPVLRGLVGAGEERLTARGRYVLCLLMALGLAGLDTRRTGVFVPFCAAAGLFASATLFAFLGRPRVRLAGGLPERVTAGAPAAVRISIAADGAGPLPDLFVTVPHPEADADALAWTRRETVLAVEAGRTAEVALGFTARRRGRYVLRGPRVAATDPLRLMATAAVSLPGRAVLAYPRYWTMERFDIPLGRRHQPGGIPLTSHTGDSVEFVGTRDYRAGDPVRNLHWRSWARRGVPVVKEFQEEYFCRIAVLLDTFLPRRPRPRDLAAFEAAVSVTASVADFFSRSEHLVDILAAGPELYEVSAGRSLAYLENILDVLACLEPCHEPPFATVGPPLFERLAQITTVVAILQDWDAPREEFLRRLRALGASLRILIVHDGPTARPWAAAAEDLGALEQMTPDDVERRLAPAPADRAASGH